jgi:hypothetical protein
VKVVLVGPATKSPVGVTVSQLLLVQLCLNTTAVALVFVPAVTVRVSEGGAAPPATAVNVRAEVLKVMPSDVEPLTFRVTLAVCVTEAAVMEIVPVHVVPAVSPVGLTEIVKFVFEGLAVKFPVGEMVSQVLVVQLCSDTWAVALVFDPAVTVSVCEAGAAPPATTLNAKAEELNVSPVVVELVTFRVTLAVCVTEAAVMDIVPLHVVPAASPDGLMETVKLVFDGPAVKVPVGVRVSQVLLVQVCSDAWAVALVLDGAVTVSVCEAGAAPPATTLNVKPEELSVRTPAAAVTSRVTPKTSDPWLELT